MTLLFEKKGCYIMINWGIAGIGEVAHEFATACTQAGHKLYAVSSRSEEKAQNFVDTYHLEKGYTSYEAMLEDENLDVVYIATPHTLHFEMMKKALEAGKHVLCEKAITLNSKELETVMALAKEKNLVLAEGTTIFYMPLYHILKEQQANFGPLKMIQANFGSYKDDKHDNRFFDPKRAGGALLDIGPYAFGICQYFMTEHPHVVDSTVEYHATGVDESSVTMLKNDHHELASIAMTFRAKMPKRAIITFEKGYLTIDDYPRATRASFTTPDGNETWFDSHDDKHAFVHEFEAVNQWITDGTQSPYLEDVLNVMRLFDQCRRDWQ